VEDTPVTLEELREVFGARVAALVADESENKREGTPKTETWRIRKQETHVHLEQACKEARMIALGDKLSNLRDMARDYAVLGDALWARFNAPEDGRGIAGKKANIAWYNRGICRELEKDFSETAAWKEMDRLIREILE